MSMKKVPTVAPWGTQKFEAVHTYAPKFHQPQAQKHIDQNSTLDLGWNEVNLREKPRTVVEEMRDTLQKINGLLCDLGSRGKSTAHMTHEERRQLEGSTRDSTINSCIESLCDDISAVADQLKQDRTKPDLKLDLQNEKGIPKLEADKIKNHTKKPKPNERISSRKSSISTLNSQLSSMNSSLEISSSSLSHTETETNSSSSHSIVPKRIRLYSGTESQSGSCFYRGSEVSQIVSLHRSNFNCIAELCGYGHSITNNSKSESLPGFRTSNSTSFRA